MNESNVKKLRIPPNEKILILNAPSDYLKDTAALPEGTEVYTTPEGKYSFVHLFIENIAQLEHFGPQVLKAIDDDALLWISYPKKSSKIKTDISRDNGWEVIIHSGYEGVTQVSIDETWSALRFRPTSAIKQRTRKVVIGIEKMERKSKEKAQTKELIIPLELITHLDAHPEAKDFFDQLAPSHKRSYVDWITEAKREVTKQRRLEQTIEKLKQGIKGPYL